MTELLTANFLGVYKLAVKQVKTTEFTRQINTRGLRKVKDSIMDRGWDNSNTPYVLVPREQIPSGRETVFTEEVLGELVVYCLDGNHLLVALLHFFGPNFLVDCRLYIHFDCAETTNSLARSESMCLFLFRLLCTASLLVSVVMMSLFTETVVVQGVTNICTTRYYTTVYSYL